MGGSPQAHFPPTMLRRWWPFRCGGGGFGASGSVLLAVVAVVPVVWQLRDAPEVVAEASAPEIAPTVTAEAVREGPEVVSPVIAAVAPQPPEPAAQEPARSQEPDLVAEAVVLRPERVLTSRRSYRESFRELGEEYDGIADIYFDDTAK